MINITIFTFLRHLQAVHSLAKTRFTQLLFWEKVYFMPRQNPGKVYFLPRQNPEKVYFLPRQNSEKVYFSPR